MQPKATIKDSQMIKYKYMSGWDADLKEIFLRHKNNSIKVSQNINTSSLPDAPLIFISKHLANTGNNIDTPEHVATSIIQLILNAYHAEQSLQGLFNAIDLFKNRIRPFVAAHDYCVKVEQCSNNGEIIMNISPIYRLGPDYPDHYQSKNGIKLNDEAIIGLLEDQSIEQSITNRNTTFSLGIDAGVAFSQSKIPHNRKLVLNICIIDEGLMTSVTCENQTTTKIFSWEDIGVDTVSSDDLFDQNSHDIAVA